MNARELLLEWKRMKEEADLKWDDVHDYLCGVAGILNKIGIVEHQIDSIEIAGFESHGLEVSIWTSSYGGDNDSFVIPWEVLESKDPTAAAIALKEEEKSLKEKEARDLDRRREERKEARDLEMYLELKSKYEGDSHHG